MTPRHWLPLVLQLRQANPSALPIQLANLLQSEHSINTDGRTVAKVLQSWDQLQKEAA